MIGSLIGASYPSEEEAKILLLACCYQEVALVKDNRSVLTVFVCGTLANRGPRSGRRILPTH
jgi:hypothetical protein